MSSTAGILGEQVAVVTGGGRGIGAAISRILAEMGASVVMCGRSRETLDKAVAEIPASGGRCTAFPCDVQELGSVMALAEHVERSFGRLDVLVNNAGVAQFETPLHQVAPELWDQVLNTNLRGPYYCIRALAPMMMRARSGHIVNISSIAGKNALRNGAAYAASKWGLNGLTYSLAEELRDYNIRVSLVCPGSTASELSPHAGKNPQKMLQPGDIARVVAMLVTQSPQSFVSEVIVRPTQKP
jgi:NAD(P)-dependent dehydrogenase (short-subunit alcohol dehydrogenase family)